METFSVLLAICARNSPVTGEFPTQRPVMRCFDGVFFVCAWINGMHHRGVKVHNETQKFLILKHPNPLWRHCSVMVRKIWTHCYDNSNFNSLRSSDTYMHQKARPSLAQIMACRLIDTKPLSEPVLEYWLLDPWEQISGKLELKFLYFH